VLWSTLKNNALNLFNLAFGPRATVNDFGALFMLIEASNQYPNCLNNAVMKEIVWQQ